MYSPAKPRVTLAVNRSTSLNAIGGNAEQPYKSGSITRNSSKEFSAPSPINRNSSSEFNGSPKARHTGSFSPAQPSRHSSSEFNSPKAGYNVNPEMLVAARHSMEVKATSPKVQQRTLPPLPPLPPLSSHAQSPPASPASPVSRASLPALPASPALNTQTATSPPSPTLAPSLLSKSTQEGSGLDSAPLSPTGANKLTPRRPLPALPPVSSKRSNPLLPRAATSPDLSRDPPLPSPSPPPFSETPQLPPEASEHEKNDAKFNSNPEPAVTMKDDSSQRHETPHTPPEVNELDKKDTKYHSNPEPAVTMKDGLCQRHLSAPSSVLSETELNANAQIQEIKYTQLESKIVEKSKSESDLRVSTELSNYSPSPSPRNSTELLNDSSSPSLRQWYLKKNSVQERTKPLPKERPEYRTHRKALPELVEITQKNKLIKEIFTTEASYVDDLCVAIKVYKEPLRRYKTVSDEDITAMFSNIEELYEINKALLSSLVELIPTVNELAADEAPCPPIAGVFLRHLDKFSEYTTYLCNKDLSTRVVKEVEHLDHFKSLVKDCRQNHECNGLGLGDFLIKPVQRLCKYPLLFKELRKYLSPDDPQLPILNEVISEVEKLADVTNRTITNTEKLGQIKKIMGNDILPFLEGATLVRDGTVFVITKSKKEESFFWLLDKLILWHPMKATLRKVVKSSKCKSAIFFSSILVVNEEEYEKRKHSFSLKYKNPAGKEKRVVFCAQSYLEKLCWIEDIKAQLAK